MVELLLAVLGLFTGGALNVLADRLPPLDPEADGPFIAGRPRRLAWREWLPLLSFVGAMRERRMVIANNRLRYPALEIATAALFALSWNRFHADAWQVAAACAFSASFITLLAIDLETKYLPYKITVPTLALALAISPFWPEFDWWQGFAAALGAFAFFYGIYLLGIRMQRPLMGDGDAYLAASIGGLVGVQGTLLALYITALLGGLFAIGVLVSRVFGPRASVIPYGPHLVGGGLAAFFYGRTILDWIAGRL